MIVRSQTKIQFVLNCDVVQYVPRYVASAQTRIDLSSLYSGLLSKPM